MQGMNVLPARRRKLNNKYADKDSNAFKKLNMINRKHLDRFGVLARVGKNILLGNIKRETQANRTTVRPRRKCTYQYFLKSNDERKRIYNAFFIKTLNIGGKGCHIRYEH